MRKKTDGFFKIRIAFILMIMILFMMKVVMTIVITAHFDQPE